jgi:hypothetical protein
MSSCVEPRSNDPKFLTILQAIIASLDDISSSIDENTYLQVVNNLKLLYELYTNNSAINNSDTNNSVIYNSAMISNITNVNFTNALLVVDTMYSNMSYYERRLYEDSINPNENIDYRNNINNNYPIVGNYNNNMRIASDLWNAMSYEEQNNYRSNMHLSNLEFGGPIHRIIYPQS